MKILMFVGVGWAFGSLHSDLMKCLHARGCTCDILDWSKSYSRDEMARMADYYDCFYGVLGETWPLTDNYAIPHEKIVVVSHGDYDFHHFIETRPAEEIKKFGGYAVISQYLKDLSLELGINREPKVVRLGINHRRFYADVPDELKTVGYGGSMHRLDKKGVDWKRGFLAKEAAEGAGLRFTPAGQFHFLAMPQYYRQVDAVLVSSSCEGFGLPAMEGAASGRLVISTPVGGFAFQEAVGAGISAPVDEASFKQFATEKLIHYRQNSRLFRETCKYMREAARLLDWQNVVDEWIDLMKL